MAHRIAVYFYFLTVPRHAVVFIYSHNPFIHKMTDSRLCLIIRSQKKTRQHNTRYKRFEMSCLPVTVTPSKGRRPVKSEKQPCSFVFLPQRPASCAHRRKCGKMIKGNRGRHRPASPADFLFCCRENFSGAFSSRCRRQLLYSCCRRLPALEVIYDPRYRNQHYGRSF